MPTSEYHTDLKKELVEAREELFAANARAEKLQLEKDGNTTLAAAQRDSALRQIDALQSRLESTTAYAEGKRKERDDLQACLDDNARQLCDTFRFHPGWLPNWPDIQSVAKARLEEVTRERDELRDYYVKHSHHVLQEQLGQVRARLARAEKLLADWVPLDSGTDIAEEAERFLAESAPAAEVKEPREELGGAMHVWPAAQPKCTCQPCNCYSTDCSVHGK